MDLSQTAGHWQIHLNGKRNQIESLGVLKELLKTCNGSFCQ